MRVLGIPGSLRAASYNRSLLRAAQELAPAGMEIELFELADIPLYNADVEAQGDPDAVANFKRAIADADALLIATPEYNRGVPGVLKNAIDWASRPPFASPLSYKVVALMGASTGVSGTARAQGQLRDALSFPGAHVLDEDVRVGEAYMRFDSEGRLVDGDARVAVRRLLDELVEAVFPEVPVAAA
jgi:chromate reductase, NAD(P)H dehydrogenase (quinone)